MEPTFLIFEFRKVLYNTIKGKLGGYIYYEWKKKIYCIRQTYTDKKETPAQRVVRDAFIQSDDAWRGLSYAYRDGWRMAATRRKKFTGYALFMSTNIKRVLQGLEIILKEPYYGEN